ncbi:MAG: Rpn family recombination-promoting nuclease/putative transposase, partial [Clostridia bacterium]|nr:Rpn family recombination-promoting nuclease/putative transposase [Clostridia bacterium]
MEKKENLVKTGELMSKPFDELTFTDNFIFTRVMEANPDLCIELTELVTGRKVSRMKMESLGKEHTVKLTSDSKGVRLDVYFEDSEAMYDIEMQTSDQSDLGKRFRYYQGMTDIASLDVGRSYREMPKSYIVFLCTFDAFHRGQVKYEFRNLCVSDPELELGDETCKIAVCAFGKQAEGDRSLNALLSYMQDGSTEDDFARKLERATEDAKR